jgi:hypothetical protein
MIFLTFLFVCIIHLGISKEVEDTESPDNLIVQRRMLIQHFVEKTLGMAENFF